MTCPTCLGQTPEQIEARIRAELAAEAARKDVAHSIELQELLEKNAELAKALARARAGKVEVDGRLMQAAALASGSVPDARQTTKPREDKLPGAASSVPKEGFEPPT